MAEEPYDYSAPEGAVCFEHQDRTATFTCPRCKKHACISCFLIPVHRCVSCMRKDPAEASPPMPFEAGDGTLLGRFFRTFGTAFYPARSAPALARDDVKPAWLFFALSSLPLILLTGIIPYTRTLEFAKAQTHLIGSPSQQEIAIDVVRAIGAQLVVSGVELAALFLPFVSLVAAYAPERRNAAARAVLYRYWLAPAAMLLGYIAAWLIPYSLDQLMANPPPPTPASVFVLTLTQVVLRVVQILALQSAARIACGLSMPMSFVVVAVPFVLWQLVMPLTMRGVDRVLPQMPSESEQAPVEKALPSSNVAPRERP